MITIVKLGDRRILHRSGKRQLLEHENWESCWSKRRKTTNPAKTFGNVALKAERYQTQRKQNNKFHIVMSTPISFPTPANHHAIYTPERKKKIKEVTFNTLKRSDAAALLRMFVFRISSSTDSQRHPILRVRRQRFHNAGFFLPLVTMADIHPLLSQNQK